MNILQINGLSKNFYLHEQGRLIHSCQNVTLSLPYGGFVGVVGPSGSGKSTILRCIYRTYLPMTGEIIYDSGQFGCIDLCRANERQILHLRRYEIGYVSQFLNIMPRTTARQHVEQAVIDAGHDQAQAHSLASEMLEYFHLPSNLWDLYPNTFSGGERLRLNLAHAMVKAPKLLLLDEPTASLDPKSKENVRNILMRMKQKGTSSIGIFHDLEFMDGLCDSVLSLNNGLLS